MAELKSKFIFGINCYDIQVVLVIKIYGKRFVT